MGGSHLGCLVKDDDVEGDRTDGHEGGYRVGAHEEARHDVGEGFAELLDEVADRHLVAAFGFESAQQVVGLADRSLEFDFGLLLSLADQTRDAVDHQRSGVGHGAFESADALVVAEPVEVVDLTGFEPFVERGSQDTA